MRRIEIKPRRNHNKIVENQGLVYNKTIMPDKSVKYYWNESAAYVFDYDEIENLENATEELHDMIVNNVVPFMIEEQDNPDSIFQFPLPDYAKEYIKNSYDRGDKDVYGRFDLAYRGDEIKMLEYNADTPTGLVEAAIIQWNWLEDVYPSEDQWNSIHESLIERWAQIKAETKATSPLYLGHTQEDDSGEDALTTAYMADCAEQAGWDTIGINMKDIGYDSHTDKLIGIIYNEEDDTYDELKHLFKLYPWEDMMEEGYGEIISRLQPQWFEPAWKMPISNKMLSAAAWHLYPDHPLLLKTYIGDPGDMQDFVKKPIYGREGDRIDVFMNKSNVLKSDVYTSRWGEEGYVYQDLFPLPDFPGSNGHNHVVLGSWTVNGESVGVGIRESDGLITDAYCRFVPNVIDKTGTLPFG